MVLGSELAKRRSAETTVNLVVNGQTVRTATGNDSEHLEWKAWDVSAFKGSQATIKIVDNNRGGWGHILADEFVTSDASHFACARTWTVPRPAAMRIREQFRRRHFHRSHCQRHAAG